MSFEELGLAEPLLRAVAEVGYETPTPIQRRAIPDVLKGRDLLACARTGTGKTAAFAMPLIQRLAIGGLKPVARRPRAVVLCPTRELAIQVDESFRTYGRHTNLSTVCVYGGVSQKPQVRALRRGVDVLTATPGRLLDLHRQGEVYFDRAGAFVLDEADRMLDMGFLPDIRKVLATLPDERQSLFFSATLPRDIVDLARRILTDPVRVEVTPEATTADRVVQRVLFVDRHGKREALTGLVRDERVERALVFTRTKRKANRLVKGLKKAGVNAAAIHGNKSQNARQRALEGFRRGKHGVLVATDIASRGIDVDGITHVINYNVPNQPESYVHRIGRTARAGAGGLAVSLCAEDEIGFLRAIERTIGERIEVAGDRIGLPERLVDVPAVGEGRAPVPPGKSSGRKGRGKRRRRGRRRR